MRDSNFIRTFTHSSKQNKRSEYGTMTQMNPFFVRQNNYASHKFTQIQSTMAKFGVLKEMSKFKQFSVSRDIFLWMK